MNFDSGSASESLPSVGELQQRRGSELLRDRAEAEDGSGRDRLFRRDVGKPAPTFVNDLAVIGDNHGCARRAGGIRLVDEPIYPLREIPWNGRGGGGNRHRDCRNALQTKLHVTPLLLTVCH